MNIVVAELYWAVPWRSVLLLSLSCTGLHSEGLVLLLSLSCTGRHSEGLVLLLLFWLSLCPLSAVPVSHQGLGSTVFVVCVVRGGGFFLTCQDLGRRFNRSFPICTFFSSFLNEEISSSIPIPLFRPQAYQFHSLGQDQSTVDQPA